ncbi:MAG: response regulator [Verrucomicrobiota bacterium]|jgi:DNA-binding response OmpR family regulator
MNPEAASGKSIFYIEDDIVVLTAFRARLQKAGFDVESSVDGIEAMRILAVREFDLIILDLVLPRFSGMQILKAIRDNPRLTTIPVVVFSSNLEVVDPSVLGMADRLLLKGDCTFQNLLQSIEDLLANGRNSAGA